MTNTVETVLSTGAIFLQVLVAVLLLIALAAAASDGGRRLLGDLRDTLGGAELWLAFVVAALATGGSLFFSEYSNFVPCRLCWFQRIAMYPLVVILLGAALRRDVRGAFLYGAPIALLGSLVSAYHIYIEYHPEAETTGCQKSAPGGCSLIWFEKYGYITIPVLAATAFVTIIALLALAWSRRDRVPREAVA